ncbi:hypothetical protein NQ036_06745 [Brevibacterium sp. 91QC2O2]|uniref:hypothetical protein n=1 Tax=Brevibacterium sp. 91QC2O2 TaxID=2968458 RepID=UPI00211CB383|nr:hypothetical protein [Brevibacterium sp. 91QC2O2]MCQ9367941.1 hypothetical protein [Brevibacterium sp. 91QC2O2]
MNPGGDTDSALVTAIVGAAVIAYQVVDTIQKKRSGHTAEERAAAKSAAEELSLSRRQADWYRAEARIWEDYGTECRAKCLAGGGDPPPLPIPENILGPRP